MEVNPASNGVATETGPVDVRHHPASRIWSAFRPGSSDPRSIRVLKKNGMSHVYWLDGAGDDGSAVVAKRCWNEKALVERLVYERILPMLPDAGIRYYGFLEDPDARFSWQFIGEATGAEYSSDIAEHRAIAGRWLGAMHTLTSTAGPFGLPDRGALHYLGHLQTARRRILKNLTNPALSNEQLATLRTVVSRLDLLEKHWGVVERWCGEMPRVLTHTNYSARHLRIRADADGPGLTVFDWSSAGWGVPADDLRLFADRVGATPVDPGLTAYWSVVQKMWPRLSVEDIQRWATQGLFLRSLGNLKWKSNILAWDCATEQLRLKLDAFVAGAEVWSATLHRILQDGGQDSHVG